MSESPYKGDIPGDEFVSSLVVVDPDESVDDMVRALGWIRALLQYYCGTLLLSRANNKLCSRYCCNVVAAQRCRYT